MAIRNHSKDQDGLSAAITFRFPKQKLTVRMKAHPVVTRVYLCIGTRKIEWTPHV